MAKTPLVYSHKGSRTTIAISASFDKCGEAAPYLKCEVEAILHPGI